MLDQIENEKIKDDEAREKDKLNRQFLAKQLEIQQSSANIEVKNNLIKNLKIKLEMDIDKITDDFAKKRKEKADADAKELADANQKALDDAQALADENYLATITNERREVCCILCLTRHGATGTAHLGRFAILHNGNATVLGTVDYRFKSYY